VFLYLGKEKGRKSIESASFLDMIVVGSLQGMSVLPGISRAGITIFALLILGYKKKSAIEISFIVAIPVLLGAGLLSLPKILEIHPTILICGLILSFFTSLIGILFLLKITHIFNFGPLCFFLGILALI
jgi:undecaprenyl-diphosphatase